MPLGTLQGSRCESALSAAYKFRDQHLPNPSPLQAGEGEKCLCTRAGTSFSLLWPQDDKPPHRLWDLQPGFGGQGPAQSQLNVSTTDGTGLWFPFVKAFTASQGKVNHNRHNLCCPGPGCAQQTVCPGWQLSSQVPGDTTSPGQAAWPVPAQRKPHRCLVHPIKTGNRCLSSRE